MYAKMDQQQQGARDDMLLSGSGLNAGAFATGQGRGLHVHNSSSSSGSGPGAGGSSEEASNGSKPLKSGSHGLNGLHGLNLNLSSLSSLGASTSSGGGHHHHHQQQQQQQQHHNAGAYHQNPQLHQQQHMHNARSSSGMNAGLHRGSGSSTDGASPPPTLNFVSQGSHQGTSGGKTLLKAHNSGSSFQLPLGHGSHGPLQTHNSDGSLQTFGSGSLQQFGSGMSGLYSKAPFFGGNAGGTGSSFGVRKSDDYLMPPWSSLGSRGAPQNNGASAGPSHQQFLQPGLLHQHNHRGRGMDTSDAGHTGIAFPQQHNMSGQTQMFRSSSDPKTLMHALPSGMSEMSESSVELLRTIIHNQDISGGNDRNRVTTPLTAALAARSLSGGLGSGFSSAVVAEHKKRRVECVSPIAERPPQRVQVQPSNFAEVLSKPVLSSSMEEIIEAMSLINTGCFVAEDHKLKQLELVVKDRERRADRFHKKKATPADYLSSKIRSLKKKAYSTAASTANVTGAHKTNSSGQGCTIVVFHRKCQKHSRSCSMDPKTHSPSDIVVSSEPVTRSSYGKWMNSYMKHKKIDV